MTFPYELHDWTGAFYLFCGFCVGDWIIHYSKFRGFQRLSTGKQFVLSVLYKLIGLGLFALAAHLTGRRSLPVLAGVVMVATIIVGIATAIRQRGKVTIQAQQAPDQ